MIIIPIKGHNSKNKYAIKKKKQKIFEYLNKLSERYREVIMMRYGFEGEPKTFQEIGKSLGITRQRAEQIEKSARRALLLMIRRAGHEDFISEGYSYIR